MTTSAPQQHPATPVLVNEEYGYSYYVNIIEDIESIKQGELGKHLDVGPQACKHYLFYHMGEVKVTTYMPRNSHLTQDQIKNVVTGKRDYVGTATEAACDELDMPIKGRACTLPMLRDVWQQKVREAMFNGEILGPPSWLEEAEREEEYNRACSGGDFEARRKFVYELVLDGYAPASAYHGLKPTYSEIASMCTEVVHRCGNDGLSLFDGWHSVLGELPTELQHFVFGVVSGKTVARNEFALEFMCARLTTHSDDLAPIHVHARHVQQTWKDRFMDRNDPEFQQILLNAEVIARANYYGDEGMDDEALELWDDLLAAEYFHL